MLVTLLIILSGGKLGRDFDELSLSIFLKVVSSFFISGQSDSFNLMFQRTESISTKKYVLCKAILSDSSLKH